MEEGKIGRARSVQIQNTKKTNYRRTNSNPDDMYESDSRSFTGGMLDARTTACSGYSSSIDPALHALLPGHLLG